MEEKEQKTVGLQFGVAYKVFDTHRVSQLNLPIAQCTCGW